MVARIRLETAGRSQTPSIGGSTSPVIHANPVAEPLYEGKTLSDWLDMLGRERSTTGLKSAFDACRALVSPETSDRITQTILTVVPGLDGELNLTHDREGSSILLDAEAGRVLWKANPGPAFSKLWVREFETADENWRKRLWNYAHYARKDTETIEPFLAWAERRLSRAPTGVPSADGDTVKAAEYLRSFSANSRLASSI